MIKRLDVLVIVSLLAAISTLAQQDATKKPVSQPDPQSTSPSAGNVSHKGATADPNYVIGPEDVIDVNVWKEPDVSRTVPVRPDGKISLPLLNDVQAAGLTPAQLGAQITASLKKYVTDPQVTVIVTAINSQRIYILGEVTRPGAFPLLPGTTVLRGLSSAGGFTQFAKMKGIYVLRLEDGKQTKYPFNYKDVVSGKRPEQDILLKAGDTIVVP
jgi:polysaccharide export outer membrane protein